MQKIVVYSEALERRIQFIMSTSALRKIDRLGGIDQYLLKAKELSPVGEKWRDVIRIALERKKASAT